MIQKSAPRNQAGNEGTQDETRQKYPFVNTLSSESRLYPFYSDIKQSAPAKFLSLAELVYMALDPSIGPKNKAAALTPFNASAKRKEVALRSRFHALITDHDDDDKTAEQIRATYDPWGVAYLAYTSASHEQEKIGRASCRERVYC